MAEATPMTQQQLDQLYTSCLEAAVALLEKRGSFSPILFELRANDSVQSVAMLDMRIDDRAYGTTDEACNCIPAADDPATGPAGEADWLDDGDIVIFLAEPLRQIPADFARPHDHDPHVRAGRCR